MNQTGERGKRYILADLEITKGKLALIAEHKRRGDAGARRRLVAFLADESWHVRDAAVAALGELGGVSSADLHDIAERGFWYSRAAAAQVLGMTGGVRDIPLLVKLSSESNRSIRESVDEAIRKISKRVGPENVEAAIAELEGEKKDASRPDGSGKSDS